MELTGGQAFKDAFIGSFPKRPFSLKILANFASELSDLSGRGLGFFVQVSDFRETRSSRCEDSV